MSVLKPCHCGRPPKITKTKHYITIKASCDVCEEEVSVRNSLGIITSYELEERACKIWNNLIEKGTF